MREFLERLQQANKRIEPDESLAIKVLEAAKSESKRNSHEGRQCITRRGFGAIAAVACLSAIGVFFLRTVEAYASTQLENPKLVLKDGLRAMVKLGRDSVSLSIAMDFSCVDSAERKIRVAPSESIELADTHGEIVSELTFSPKGDCEGAVAVSVPATQEQIRELWEMKDMSPYYRLAYECLMELEHAEITVEAEGKRPTSYGFALRDVETWEDLQLKEDSGERVVIDLIER